MHYSLLVIAKVDDVNPAGFREGGECWDNLDRILSPFHEAWEEDDPRTVRDEDHPDEDAWYNPDARYDWCVIGGRYYGMLCPGRGVEGYKAMWDWDERTTNWYVGGQPVRDGFDIVLVDRIERNAIDPSDFASVLLPDGTWHDMESDQGVPNPEWERFYATFISPYENRNYSATVIDYHF